MFEMTIPQTIEFLKTAWQTMTISEIIVSLSGINAFLVAVLPPEWAKRINVIGFILGKLESVRIKKSRYK